MLLPGGQPLRPGPPRPRYRAHVRAPVRRRIRRAPTSATACGPTARSRRPEPCRPARRWRAIAERGRLIAGVDQGKYLAGYRDPQTGELRGSDIDIVHTIAQAILGDPDKVQFVVLDIADRVAAVERGEVDVVVDHFTVTCARQRTVEFSTPYMPAVQRLLVPVGSGVREVEDLAGQRVCTSRGSTTEGVLRALPVELDVLSLRGIPDCVVEMRAGPGGGRLQRRRHPRRAGRAGPADRDRRPGAGSSRPTRWGCGRTSPTWCGSSTPCWSAPGTTAASRRATSGGWAARSTRPAAPAGPLPRLTPGRISPADAASRSTRESARSTGRCGRVREPIASWYVALRRCRLALSSADSRCRTCRLRCRRADSRAAAAVRRWS